MSRNGEFVMENREYCDSIGWNDCVRECNQIKQGQGNR